MSIDINFNNNNFYLNKLKLPSRYFHFYNSKNEEENYIKLLTIGEGIFPKDKIKSSFNLINSSCIFTTESATKIYPSKKEYGVNSISINLNNSNCEFINDELILYKKSKLMSFLKINMEMNSTLFYVDILSSGRSFENFDFTSMLVRNRFYIDSKLEYYENYNISAKSFKNYIKRHNSKQSEKQNIYAKIYIKIDNNDKILNILEQNKFTTFTYTHSKKMLIGVINKRNMCKLKKNIKKIWDFYRIQLNKKPFNLGKG